MQRSDWTVQLYVIPIFSLPFFSTFFSLLPCSLAGCHMFEWDEKWRSQLLKLWWFINCFVSRRTEKKKRRKHHQLAQLIKVINTLAILFIVIPELTKYRTTKCLGHLHIVRMPLVWQTCSIWWTQLNRHFSRHASSICWLCWFRKEYFALFKNQLKRMWSA